MKKLKEIIHQIKWKMYVKKHTKLTNEYIEKRCLRIGKKYTGKQYLSGKVFTGTLEEVWVSSDGAFAVIDGNEDIIGSSLTRIG